MKKILTLLACTTLGASALTGCASYTAKQAKTETVNVYAVDRQNFVSAHGIGVRVGTLRLSDSPEGLRIKTHLYGLLPGVHGWHIHEKYSCSSAAKDGQLIPALAAGGHFNPTQVAHHGSPTTGHLGDLPVLTIDAKGRSSETLIAPRLKLADIHQRAIVIHAGGDNYADEPLPVGGGGERVACGLIY